MQNPVYRHEWHAPKSRPFLISPLKGRLPTKQAQVLVPPIQKGRSGRVFNFTDTGERLPFSVFRVKHQADRHFCVIVFAG